MQIVLHSDFCVSFLVQALLLESEVVVGDVPTDPVFLSRDETIQS